MCLANPPIFLCSQDVHAHTMGCKRGFSLDTGINPLHLKTVFFKQLHGETTMDRERAEGKGKRKRAKKTAVTLNSAHAGVVYRMKYTVNVAIAQL